MSHRKYLLASRLVRMIVLSAAVAGGAVMLAAGRADAASPAAAPAAIASNPARDQAVKLFLQRKFRIPTIEEIKLGPLERTGIPGLYGRSVAVTNDKGQTASVVMFTNPEETKAIIGQFMDLNADPWGRTDMRMIHLEDRPTLGPADAPITIVEFGDFECPYCARAFGDIETLVNTTYKGKVRLIFKNFPLNIHPWATQAAIAAECVRRQNPQAFWPFADDIYRDQGEITPQNLRQHVVGYATKLGLDNQVLEACMMGSEAAKQVDQDRNEGNAVGINSTPTFFVNGIELVGLPTGKTFDYVINSELKKHAEARR